MALSTAVKFFRSTDGGAPTLSGSAGALAGVLDACLVNGYNPKSGLTLVLGGDGKTVTATLNAHGFKQYDVVTIGGASDAAYNGEFRVTTAATNSFTYETTGTTTSTPSGTITATRTAAGWTQPFTGTNLRTYKPSGTGASTNILRLDDTTTTYATVRGYRAMTDINNGTEPFPAVAQVALANARWYKSDTASTAAREWALIADSRFFWLYTRPTAAASGWVCAAFGDFIDFRPSSTGGTMVSFANSTNATYPTSVSVNMGPLIGDVGGTDWSTTFIGRNYTELPDTPVSTILRGVNAATNVTGAVNAADLAIYLQKPVMIAGSVFRGELPGFHQVMHGNTAVGQWTPITDALADRVLMASYVPNQSVNTVVYEHLIDIIGPWRA